MCRARNEFFAGSRLSQDQHARIRGRHHRHQAQRGLQRRALSDNFTKLGANFLLKIASLFCLLVSVLDRRFIIQRILNRNGYLAGHLFEKNDVISLECPLRSL